jgi:glycerophosphoryl diester phosphodiesterase
MLRHVTKIKAVVRSHGRRHGAWTVLVLGHRGAGGDFDENTLDAFRHALDCGADGIEFDVRLLDGELIVLHDDTLERTTNGGGHYKALSLAALRALRTRQGGRIPLLDEVLAVVGGRGLVNVEVKEAGIGAQVLTAIHAWLASRPARADDVLLSSFDPLTTALLARDRAAGIRLGVLYTRDEGLDAALARAAALGAWSIHLPLADVDEATIARVHAHGLHALVYTVNADDDLAHCLACGVDGVFSDFPARALSVAHASSAHGT